MRFVSFSVKLPRAFIEGLEPKNLLTNGEKLFLNKLNGPESIAEFNGKLYTGSSDGYIYEINNNQAKRFLKLTDSNEKQHPRPLGIRITSKGILYVVFASEGIYSADLRQKNPKLLKVLPIEETSKIGAASKFLDDVAIDEEAGTGGGDVLYITDVSSKFSVEQSWYIMSGSEVGRILKYDINNDKLEMVSDNIYFPNGIELTDDRQAVLFNELTAQKVYKLFIKGKNVGQKQLFTVGLPGEPDNIRRSALKEETYWVAVAMARNLTSQNTQDWLNTRPVLRKLLLRSMNLIGKGLQSLGKLTGYYPLQEIGTGLTTGADFIMTYKDQYGMVIEIDKNGKIINSLHSPDGKFSLLSEAKEIRLNEHETVVYLGSFVNDFLGKIYLKR